MKLGSLLATAAAFVIVASAGLANANTGAIEILNPKIARGLDGKAPRCASAANAGNSRWTLETASLRGVGADTIELSGNLQFYACVATEEGKGAWREGRVEEPYAKTVRGGRKVWVWSKENQFVIGNSRWRMLSNDSLPATGTVEFKKSFAVDEILTPEQVSAVNAGRTVQGFLVLFPRSKKFYRYEGQSETKPLGFIEEQAFYIWYHVRRTSDGYEFQVL